jgi:hypothetical protein
MVHTIAHVEVTYASSSSLPDGLLHWWVIDEKCKAMIPNKQDTGNAAMSY